MKMVPLKFTKSEMKLRSSLSPVSVEDRPKYPWGTELHLDNKGIEKLKLDPSDFEAGDVVEFQARAIVTSVSKRETTEGSDKSMSFQITHLAIGGQGDDEEN